MSACLCTYGFHDEMFTFTGVERTNTEIYVNLFDNANVYMIKKQQGGKISNNRQTKKVNPTKGSFTVSIKYKIYSKTHDNSKTHDHDEKFT